MLNIKLSKDEIIVLNELFVYFKQTGEWYGVRTINSKFGRTLLAKISQYKPSLLEIGEDQKDRKKIYKLTFEGIYVCPLAKNDLNLLRAYLQLLIDKFHTNPEIKDISCMEVESNLKINTDESRVLRDLIMIGYFWGGSASHGLYWQVGVPEDIEDLVELGPDKYIKKNRQRFWKTDERGGIIAQDSKFDLLALKREIEAQKSLMIVVATGGPKIQAVNNEYIERAERIKSVLTALNIEDPNPYTDLWDWYGKWSSGDLPTYQSRRQYIRDLYAPLLEKLSQRPAILSGPLREPTGWERVDRGIDKIRKQVEIARNEEDFQSVGLLCRETLISLAQAVYNPQRHCSTDGVELSPTDVKRMLDVYIETELRGSGNDEARKHAKTSLNLANELQHKRTADFRSAAMCAEATTSVVNLIATVSGRRDPDKQR